MSVQTQVQQVTSPDLRRASRATEHSGSGATNGVNSVRDVEAAGSTSTLSPEGSKPTPFKRLKLHFAKRPKRFKGKADQQTPLQSSNPEPEPHPSEAAPGSKSPTVPSNVAADGDPSTGHIVNSEQPVDHDTDDNNAADTVQTMSPTNLAHRIQSLLSSLPPFYTVSTSETLQVSNSTDQGPDEPEAGAPYADSKFLSLLSSTSAMNGSISKGRESVWAILERLGRSPNAKGAIQAGSDSGASSDGSNVEVSSVMICCPLEPTADTEVEIARSEVVSISLEHLPLEPAGSPKGQAALRLWPFGKGKSEGVHAPERTVAPSVKITEVRVWYPSRTKVSLQAAWWGYRIYLPPPVMLVLNDTSLETAKRAAMIATALGWLVSHIPTSMLPPPLQAIVEVVKGIVPMIGYVSGFIAWSWSTIKSFDKGQGVILSATWLLPIALIPGAWDYTEPPPSQGQSGNGSPP